MSNPCALDRLLEFHLFFLGIGLTRSKVRWSLVLSN